MELHALSPRDLQFEVEQLLYRYVETLDSDRLEEWPDFFTENAFYQIIARENYDRGLPLAAMLCESRGFVQDRVTAFRQASVYSPRSLRHLVSNVRVTAVKDGVVEARANFAVLQTLVDDETRVFLSGWYRDRIVLDGVKLRYAEKHCIYDTLRIPNSIVYPV